MHHPSLTQTPLSTYQNLLIFGSGITGQSVKRYCDRQNISSMIITDDTLPSDVVLAHYDAVII